MALNRFWNRTRPAPKDADDRETAVAIETEDDTVDPSQGDLDVFLGELEAEALGIFARHGLPTDVGVYRRRGQEPWEFLGARVPVADRWAMVLEQPPEAGWRYVQLAEIGRAAHPHDREVAAAALLLEAIQNVRRFVAGDGGQIDPAAETALRAGLRLAFSLERVGRVTGRKLLPYPNEDLFTAELAGAPLLRRRAAEDRHWQWRQWRAEAGAIWALHPQMGTREVAERVKKNLRLMESVHSIRRRISRPAEQAAGASTDRPTH